MMKHIKKMKKILTVLFCAFFALGLNAQHQHKKPLVEHMTTNGDGTGTQNWIGNYSVTNDTAYYLPPVGDHVVIHKLDVIITDGGTVNTNTYGALTALTNGIVMQLRDDNGVVEVFADSVKTNGGWFDLTDDYKDFSLAGGDKHLKFSFYFAEGLGEDMNLDNIDSTNPRFEIILRDDFTGLVEHYFIVHGYFDDETY